MILDGYGESLYQDGLSAFAIGSLNREEELFVQKYKVLSIYSPKISRFAKLLERFGVSRTSKLVTAYTFHGAPSEAQRPEHPGSSDMIKDRRAAMRI